MIARLRGTLLEKQPTRLVVETGGIGLEVLVPLSTSQGLGEVGGTVELFTVLVVREDALTLYGFESAEQKSLFQKLVGVSGVGPKTALGALSGSSVVALAEALRNQDLAVLTRLPGIGKKTAERMALELKDALVEFGVGEEAGRAGDRQVDDAVAALVSLGYPRTAALQAIRGAAGDGGGEVGVETLLRVALARLSGGKPGRGR
jgi:Holliday junction DNA helicase RuvA